MRKLTAAEIKKIADDLFNGRPVSVEVEDFDFGEFTLQQAAAQQKSGKNADDPEPTSDKVGG